MIAKPDLLKNARNKFKDAQVLLDNRRYASSIYLAGYAVEMALKHSICRFCNFRKGFPEHTFEFDRYFATSPMLRRNILRDIRQIKTHDLSRLLFFSGKELPILTDFSEEWATVKEWTHLKRYSVTTVRKAEADRFLTAARVIADELF